MLLKKISFIAAVTGIGVLLLLMAWPSYMNINEIDIHELEVNTKVDVIGNVKSERDLGDFKILRLENKDFDIICDCEESYLDKDVEVFGKIEEYEGKKQVRVLSISALK